MTGDCAGAGAGAGDDEGHGLTPERVAGIAAEFGRDPGRIADEVEEAIALHGRPDGLGGRHDAVATLRGWLASEDADARAEGMEHERFVRDAYGSEFVG